MPDPTSLLEIGNRLAVTRKALGLTQAEMDRMMGSTYTDGQTCNTYETGRQRIPTHHALALCRTCGITLDWIYRGQMHSLQPDICAKLSGIGPAALVERRGQGHSVDIRHAPTTGLSLHPHLARGA
jgi:hypothetical protein